MIFYMCVEKLLYSIKFIQMLLLHKNKFHHLKCIKRKRKKKGGGEDAVWK